MSIQRYAWMCTVDPKLLLVHVTWHIFILSLTEGIFILNFSEWIFICGFFILLIFNDVVINAFNMDFRILWPIDGNSSATFLEAMNNDLLF